MVGITFAPGGTSVGIMKFLLSMIRFLSSDVMALSYPFHSIGSHCITALNDSGSGRYLSIGEFLVSASASVSNAGKLDAGSLGVQLRMQEGYSFWFLDISLRSS